MELRVCGHVVERLCKRVDDDKDLPFFAKPRVLQMLILIYDLHKIQKQPSVFFEGNVWAFV